MDPARPLRETPTPAEPPAPTATEVTYRPGIGVMAAIRPAPLARPFLEEGDVVVTVQDTDGTPQEGLPVYAFDGSSYTGIHGTTDSLGQVTLNLPDSDYRFRTNLNGTHFWSGEANHCAVPGCTAAGITVSIPVTISVADTDGIPQEGLPVYAFTGGAYSGYHGTTDVGGEVSLTLPPGDYRFRTDKDGTQFWSGESDHCSVPGCLDTSVVVTIPLTVTVEDTDGDPQEGLPVYAFDGETYTGYHGATDESGEAVFTLPQGSYRFRSDLNGTQFWSGEANHCDVPGCLEADVVVTIPLTVTVQSQTGAPYPGLPVYAFSGGDYSGDHGTTDENGEVVFTLPEGSFRFRTDYDGVQFWSGETDHCTVPGCLEALVEIPGGSGEESVVIDYEYDALYRLTAADYSTGEYFHYAYDAVGNRLEQETHEGTSTYAYDAANRLINVDGVAYTWSANGNLLNDGVSMYSYDHANRLTGVVQGSDSYLYAYNGLGDRLAQSVNGEYTSYTLDIVSPLTQVLADGENAYLYGLARLGEEQADGWQMHLGDALGSVRQLADGNASVTMASAYAPFGDVLSTSGDAETIFQYTGEQLDPTGLVYLRARYYAPASGRFLTMDAWDGDPYQPLSYNPWLYVAANPVNFVDPSGLWYCTGHPDCEEWVNHALDILQENSPTGARLVAFLQRYDQTLERIGYDDLSMYGIMTGIDINDCRDDENVLSGLQIAFVPNPFPRSGANTLFSGMLQMSTAYITDPDQQEAGVIILGHEISHYTQGFHRYTIQGEVLARIVERKLRDDLLGLFGEVPRGGLPDTNSLSVLNPFSIPSLYDAQTYMINNMDSSYILLPLRLGLGLGPDWLTQLSISADYRRDVIYPTAPPGPSGM